MKVVTGRTTTLDKSSSAAAAQTAGLADEISLMRKIKAHLKDCQCCAAALKSDLIIPENNSEAGYSQPPDSTATPHTTTGKSGVNVTIDG